MVAARLHPATSTSTSTSTSIHALNASADARARHREVAPPTGAVTAAAESDGQYLRGAVLSPKPVSLEQETGPSDTLRLTAESARRSKRISSVDCLRGLVILLMMVDHVRERFYYQYNVSDPMDLESISRALFFTRMTSHLCAPTFVFLSGLGAWLYAHPAFARPRPPSCFLFKRGLFLVILEITLVNFSWFGNFNTIYLQVIWAIGLSMLALSAIVKLHYRLVGLVGLVIVVGHNLLSPISLDPGDNGYTLWAILLGRGVIFDGPFRIKASYPVLPWIGVVSLGYFAGPLYACTMDRSARRRWLIYVGVGLFALLLIIRGFNIYGEVRPWQSQGSAVLTVMDFVNFTKYPPSLDFLLLTISPALSLLACFEALSSRVVFALELFGSAPLFIYVSHLYVLLISYRVVLATVGPNAGDLFAFAYVWEIWAVAALLALALYYPTKVFARFKRKTKKSWVKYF